MAAGRSAMIVAVTAAVCPLVFAGAGQAAAGTRVPAAARAAALGGTWHAAIEVPGIAALNQGGFAQLLSVSCASKGNCSAGGLYNDSVGRAEAFVVSEVNGSWRTAVEVPGTAALNRKGMAGIASVSCASAGNCSAGGWYADSSGKQQAFVASEVNRSWHTAVVVPGVAALNKGGTAAVLSVSCGSAGNCSAGGSYLDGAGLQQAFVVSEVNGSWHTAAEVRGTAALNKGGFAQVLSVSCGSAGNCSAGGFYSDSSRRSQAFVVSEVNGSWRTAIEVPGTAALNKGLYAAVQSVSCRSAGNCSAGGLYHASSGTQAFVVSEVNGSWRTAIEVPGTAVLNKGGNAQVLSVSCASAGNCGAGGLYTGSSGHQQAFVVSKVNGSWHTATEVPGTAALNKGGTAAVYSVSCGSAGNCSAGGTYTGSSGHTQAFVVSEVNGTWHAAIEVPGTAALNKGGDARIFSVSCASAGNCSAGGIYLDGSRHTQAFVVSES